MAATLQASGSAWGVIRRTILQIETHAAPKPAIDGLTRSQSFSPKASWIPSVIAQFRGTHKTAEDVTWPSPPQGSNKTSGRWEPGPQPGTSSAGKRKTSMSGPPLKVFRHSGCQHHNRPDRPATLKEAYKFGRRLRIFGLLEEQRPPLWVPVRSAPRSC
jgi:hypothetical protein